MFHGGTNPKGVLTTLQESQATKFPNDLPELTYDFNAPLGEFGQQRESYRKTRMLHVFLNAYGSQLATMSAFAPAQRSRDASDTSSPRVAVRTDGTSGFVFVNNYVRQLEMPARRGFQINLKLANCELQLPTKPIDVPANTYFAWPVNLAVGKSTMLYSTAQLLTRLDTPAGNLIVFFAIPGIAPQFAFDNKTVRTLSARGATIAHTGDSVTITSLHPGINTTVNITDTTGTRSTLVLLTQQQAEQTSVLHIAHHDHPAMTASTLLFDGKAIHLRSAGPTQHLALLPALGPSSKYQSTLWATLTRTQPQQHLTLDIKQTSAATPRAQMDMGPYVDWRKAAVPTVPPDAAFDNASSWQLTWTRPTLSHLSNVLLQLEYTGDIARLYSGSTLVDDNFFNGLPFEFSVTRLPTPLTLKILPMPAVAPIYLDTAARALLGTAPTQAKLVNATLVPEYESVISIP